jgi:hypothetical protein
MKILCLAFLLPVLAALAADAPATFKVADYTFKTPAKWQQVEPSSAMRKAQLLVPAAKGAGADVIFFHFGPGDGGGTQANVDRWIGQFKDTSGKKVTEGKVGGRKINYVQTEGAYSGGMPGRPGGEFKDYALLGAIVESDSGNIFIKMTGPKDVVKGADADFRKMVEDALKK